MVVVILDEVLGLRRILESANSRILAKRFLSLDVSVDVMLLVP
jgi:hypothetical protein